MQPDSIMILTMRLSWQKDWKDQTEMKIDEDAISSTTTMQRPKAITSSKDIKIETDRGLWKIPIVAYNFTGDLQMYRTHTLAQNQ